MVQSNLGLILLHIWYDLFIIIITWFGYSIGCFCESVPGDAGVPVDAGRACCAGLCRLVPYFVMSPLL